MQGRHAVPPGGLAQRHLLVTAGAVAVAFIAISCVTLVGRGATSSAEALTAQTTGSRVAAVTQTDCDSAVTALLREDLERVANGRPDVGVVTAPRVAASLGGEGSRSMVLVRRIHDAIIGDATTDLINRFQRQVPALLADFGPRIDNACVMAVASTQS
jgi:hypothetical protein